jgi:hypothetical protein
MLPVPLVISVGGGALVLLGFQGLKRVRLCPQSLDRSGGPVGYGLNVTPLSPLFGARIARLKVELNVSFLRKGNPLMPRGPGRVEFAIETLLAKQTAE